MTDVVSELTAPSHFHGVGWQGLTLVVPDTWNLRLFDGNFRRGAVFFSDLHGTHLEVRWRTSSWLSRRRGNGLGLLRDHASQLRRRHAGTLSELAGGAVRLDTARAAFVLATVGSRLCELHWPAATFKNDRAILDPTLRHFLQSAASVDENAARFWSVYGAAGHVPASARLRKAKLLPGMATLTFSDRGGPITLGAVSMADRLLVAAGGLRNWARSAIPLVSNLPAGTWQEGDKRATFTVCERRRFRVRRHLLTLLHDPVANRICWSHRAGRTVE